MNDRSAKQAYLPTLEGIVAILAQHETFTYKQMLPLLTECGLASQIVWPVIRKRYLEIVERRTRAQGHVYRVPKRSNKDQP